MSTFPDIGRARVSGAWTSDDGDHEGWVAAEFPDGRVSVAYSAGGVHVVTPAEAISPCSPLPPDVVDGRTAIGWRGMCGCGWTGPLWRRVPSLAGHDLAKRQVHADPGDWADDPPEVEEAIRSEWRRHLPAQSLTVVAEAATAARQAQNRLTVAVAAARADHQSWEAIGGAAGISKQAAHERWGP
jgi:hypothetical protein